MMRYYEYYRTEGASKTGFRLFCTFQQMSETRNVFLIIIDASNLGVRGVRDNGCRVGCPLQDQPTLFVYSQVKYVMI